MKPIPVVNRNEYVLGHTTPKWKVVPKLFLAETSRSGNRVKTYYSNVSLIINRDYRSRSRKNLKTPHDGFHYIPCTKEGFYNWFPANFLYHPHVWLCLVGNYFEDTKEDPNRLSVSYKGVAQHLRILRPLNNREFLTTITTKNQARYIRRLCLREEKKLNL